MVNDLVHCKNFRNSECLKKMVRSILECGIFTSGMFGNELFNNSDLRRGGSFTGINQSSALAGIKGADVSDFWGNENIGALNFEIGFFGMAHAIIGIESGIIDGVKVLLKQ